MRSYALTSFNKKCKCFFKNGNVEKGERTCRHGWVYDSKKSFIVKIRIDKNAGHIRSIEFFISIINGKIRVRMRKDNVDMF